MWRQQWLTMLGSALLMVTGCSRCHSSRDEPEQAAHASGRDRFDDSVHVEAEIPGTLRDRVATLADIREMRTDELLSAYDLEQATELDYDPLEAENLALLQDSRLALDDDELGVFAEHGLVMSDRRLFPTFAYGYVSIYAEDLPVFISADSLLFALHRSYSAILKAVEAEALIPELKALLEAMRQELAGGRIDWASESVIEDVDFYLAMALSLLSGEVVPMVAGGDRDTVEAWFEDAQAAAGRKSTMLFGARREVDFSQFEPRGHYADDAALSRYFQALMWLGRIDLRLLEADEPGGLVVRPKQAEMALALVELMSEPERERWENIDAALEAFVGESDSMSVDDMVRLTDALGLDKPGELSEVAPQVLAEAVQDGALGKQRISGHIMQNGIGEATMPLSYTFLLLGQRYVVDSHVFSNVVYDRVATRPPRRMLPDPLDVAFAALRNDQAAHLLEEELSTYDYGGDLAAMRHLIDDLGEGYWEGNMYTLWLRALRALSPKAEEVAHPQDYGLPTIAGTEAWGRRILNTQLASWAELRRDTVLYTKQSHSTVVTCEYPDAYVDPYPEFYATMATFAAHSKELMNSLEFSNDATLERVDAYFETMHEVHTTLGQIAVRQRAGEPLAEEHLAFINRSVSTMGGCGGPDAGWYGDLFYSLQDAIDYDPTIADVHTAPTDAGGRPTGEIVHVATGRPRLMVTTIDTCNGPRVYTGVASSYFEKTTRGYERVDDRAWAQEIKDGHPDDVWWIEDLVVR